MPRTRTRITVDGVVLEVLKNGQKTYTEYDTEIEALNAAKSIIENEIAERNN